MKKSRLSIKAAVSLILSVILLCMPAVAFSMNGNYTRSVRAENAAETKEGADSKKTESESETKKSTDTKDVENNPVSGEDGTVSEDDISKQVCTCEDKCGAYEYEHNCEVCVSDYKLCTYKKPNVTININKPDGWHHDTTTVTVEVKDVAHTGNFEAAKIQAKIGQNGSWTDITEDKKLEISENCTVYVQVTDQKDNIYEKNRAIKCFDTTKPTLNAAVSDGLLSVQVHDTDSGTKAVYVNGYEFTKLTKGTLNIRLQQFDAGYEYFTISAMDNAGNMSEVYKTKNPYYKDPADESDENPAGQLLVNAEATEPGNATGMVTEHTKTDSGGNAVSQTSSAGQKEQAKAKVNTAKAAESGKKDSTEQSEQGKEFYTIQTATDKVFYLIIDRDGDEEMVYFLTEITENDLLNTTSDNSETLPKNSAALESAIMAEESALPNNNGDMPENTEENVEETDNTENIEETESTEETNLEEETAKEPNPMASYILIGGVAVVFIGGAYYFKVVRKKKENFVEDEDEEEEYGGEYENEEEEPKEDSEGDFFDKDAEK